MWIQRQEKNEVNCPACRSPILLSDAERCFPRYEDFINAMHEVKETDNAAFRAALLGMLLNVRNHLQELHNEPVSRPIYQAEPELNEHQY